MKKNSIKLLFTRVHQNNQYKTTINLIV